MSFQLHTGMGIKKNKKVVLLLFVNHSLKRVWSVHYASEPLQYLDVYWFTYWSLSFHPLDIR